MDTDEYSNYFSTTRYIESIIIVIDLLGFKNYIYSNLNNEQIIIELTSRFQKQVNDGKVSINGNAKIIYPVFKFFSDSIFISFPKVPFEYYSKEVLFHAIDCMIHGIQINALDYGVLSRGCVHFGKIYHNKDTWFGPGLNEAHELESNLAIYPRVIFSKTALEFFKTEIMFTFKTSNILDSDGFFFINYISWCYFNSQSNDFNKSLIKLSKTISENLLELKTKHKERQKWQWLAKYFNEYILKNGRDVMGILPINYD